MVDKRPIALFSAHYLPHVGGVEVFTEGLARALEASGRPVVVVTSNLYDLAVRERLSPLVEIVRLPCWKLLGGRMPLSKANSEQKRLLRSLETIDFAGVVVNTRFYSHSLLGARFARKKGLRPVVIDHGADYLTFGSALLDPFVRAYEHGVTGLLKRQDPAFYGISADSAAWLRTFGIEARGVIPNAIDAAGFVASATERSFRDEAAVPSDHIVASYVGRLIPEKGVEAIVRAAAELYYLGKPISFLMAGEGSLEESLCREAAPNVHFLGRLGAKDVAALLRDSDILCFPSRSEGFGSALLEAAVFGNALVATDVGIARSLIAGDGGVLLGAAAPDAIAAAVARYVDDPSALARAQRAAAHRSRVLYSWDNSVRAVEAACGLS